MANRERGEVELKAGDKTYVLRYTTNALVKLEDVLGKPVSKMGGEEISMKEARAMVWAGLLHAYPDLTPEQAGDIIDAAGLTQAARAVGEALRLAFGSGEGKTGTATVAAPSSAGASFAGPPSGPA